MSELTEPVTFGKYRGRTTAELLSDKSYTDWLMANGVVSPVQHATIYQLIINSGSEPEETPEHNALQARFLDEALHEEIEEVIQAFVAKYGVMEDQEVLYDPIIMNRSFENVANVRLQMRLRLRTAEDDARWLLAHTYIKGEIEFATHPHIVTALNHTYDWSVRNIAIEVKPTMGDDYPRIIRQMRVQRDRITHSNNKDAKGRPVDVPPPDGINLHQILVVSSYTGDQSIDVVRRITRESGVLLVVLP